MLRRCSPFSNHLSISWTQPSGSLTNPAELGAVMTAISKAFPTKARSTVVSQNPWSSAAYLLSFSVSFATRAQSVRQQYSDNSVYSKYRQRTARVESGLCRWHGAIPSKHIHSSSQEANLGGRGDITCVIVILANTSWSAISTLSGFTLYRSVFLVRMIDLLLCANSWYHFTFVFRSAFLKHAPLACCFSFYLFLSTFLEL